MAIGDVHERFLVVAATSTHFSRATASHLSNLETHGMAPLSSKTNNLSQTIQRHPTSFHPVSNTTKEPGTSMSSRISGGMLHSWTLGHSDILKTDVTITQHTIHFLRDGGRIMTHELWPFRTFWHFYVQLCSCKTGEILVFFFFLKGDSSFRNTMWWLKCPRQAADSRMHLGQTRSSIWASSVFESSAKWSFQTRLI